MPALRVYYNSRSFGRRLKKMKRLVKLVKQSVTWGTSVFALISFTGTFLFAQGLGPGVAGICAFKNWVLLISGAFAVGGLSWLGSGMIWSRNHADGMHPIVEKIPGTVLAFLPAVAGAWFGAAYC
jgi:hypothetical protein